MARSNCTPARGVTTGKMDEAAWDTLDALPRPLRMALWESPVPINPASVAGALAHSTTDSVLARIRSSVADEIALYAREHRRRWGYELPHVAAEVEVQPYEAGIMLARRRR